VINKCTAKFSRLVTNGLKPGHILNGELRTWTESEFQPEILKDWRCHATKLNSISKLNK
jgi:hypothetical protein